MNLSDALASEPQPAGDSHKPSGAGRDVDPLKLDTVAILIGDLTNLGLGKQPVRKVEKEDQPLSC